MPMSSQDLRKLASRHRYVPGEYEQRPPRELAEVVLIDLLREAMTYAYATGSVGGSVGISGAVPDELPFEFSVSFEIRRKPAGA